MGFDSGGARNANSRITLSEATRLSCGAEDPRLSVAASLQVWLLL